MLEWNAFKRDRKNEYVRAVRRNERLNGLSLLAVSLISDVDRVLNPASSGKIGGAAQINWGEQRVVLKRNLLLEPNIGGVEVRPWGSPRIGNI